MIERYIKKPIAVEAIQWNVSNIEEAIAWLGDNLVSEAREGIGCVGYWIKNSKGTTMIFNGDYIIKEANGEFYLCKPNIFNKTYEVVNE